MFIFVNPVQRPKAQSPIVVMELGIKILASPAQARNAPNPMDVTELGMIVLLQPTINVLLNVSMMALQLSRES